MGKYTVRISKEDDEYLTKISEKLGISKDEVLKQGIGLMAKHKKNNWLIKIIYPFYKIWRSIR